MCSAAARRRRASRRRGGPDSPARVLSSLAGAEYRVAPALPPTVHVQRLSVLALTAVSVGFFHTLFGPDHYLPFIVMAKAREWSFARTFWITFVSGLGHVLSSVALGHLPAPSGHTLSNCNTAWAMP